VLKRAGVRLLIKREDLNHPFISGNKWWKLRYNLEEAQRQGQTTLLTFGGAYSNHIYATAAAANELGFKSVGIIRGEETLPLNPTLQFARQQGMHLHYISRTEYRTKSDPSFIRHLHDLFGNFYLVPEGGTNVLAVKGCEEYAHSLPQQIDYVCLPVGTGGTISGIIKAFNGSKEILGFSVLKNGEFLAEEVEKLSGHSESSACWKIINEYHFGGYAKFTQALSAFIKKFQEHHNISLDFVYTGKMMYGIFDLIDKNYFRHGSTILAIHTGGLQGNPSS
jgi:1-aminocyclopropane-1-carboxylate deaminase